MLKISNNLLSSITACLFFPFLCTHADEDTSRLVGEYLLNEGKPTDRNSEIWADLATVDDYALQVELVRIIDRDSEFLPKVHIAKIASGLLPKEQARNVVLQALASAEDERPDLRYLFAESVVKVALPQDVELLKSFRDTNRRGITEIVDFAIAKIADGSSSADLVGRIQIQGDSDNLPTKNAAEASPDAQRIRKGSLVWPIILGVVVTLGIVVVLLRRQNRKAMH